MCSSGEAGGEVAPGWAQREPEEISEDLRGDLRGDMPSSPIPTVAMSCLWEGGSPFLPSQKMVVQNFENTKNLLDATAGDEKYNQGKQTPLQALSLLVRETTVPFLSSPFLAGLL